MRICYTLGFMTFVWHFLEACTGFIHYMFQLGLFSKPCVKKSGEKSDERTVFHSLANGFKLKTAASLFWCEHV